MSKGCGRLAPVFTTQTFPVRRQSSTAWHVSQLAARAVAGSRDRISLLFGLALTEYRPVYYPNVPAQSDRKRLYWPKGDYGLGNTCRSSGLYAAAFAHRRTNDSVRYFSAVVGRIDPGPTSSYLEPRHTLTCLNERPELRSPLSVSPPLVAAGMSASTPFPPIVRRCQEVFSRTEHFFCPLFRPCVFKRSVRVCVYCCCNCEPCGQLAG